MTGSTPEYIERHLVQAVADHPRLGELEVGFSVEGNRIRLSGGVSSDEHRRILVQLVRDLYPDHEVSDQTAPTPASPPPPGDRQ